MSDPREELLTQVNFDQVEVSEYPKIAFLCGGEPNTILDRDSDTHFFPSVRSYISNCLPVYCSGLKFQNAEDVKDWNSYSLYEDLIEFEQDIAHICKVIVLFVESPGSIAELGSFAMIREISEKLIVFVHEDYSDSASFISLGALKRIGSQDSEKIHFIGWEKEPKNINRSKIDILDVKSIEQWQEYTCKAIGDAIEKRSSYNRSPEECIRTKEVLFIHDLIILFKAITEEELVKYFKIVNHDTKNDIVSRSIFCLIKLDLIRSITKGNKTFLTPSHDVTKRFLTLPIRIDTARLAIQIDDYYKHPAQMLRREAIKTIVGVPA
jgi:hypothetical protein